ncbi:MAG: hypothetical protein M1837_003482 [Sclerophora amabilis]|nr:MAG: hypothetical protein M1837_003482 [Sclerophora amabilis]
MHDNHPHPLLAQIPLTVSPFVSLPTATTLPYTYKSLPSKLPPSSTGDSNGTEKPKYVVSSSGHAAHPDEIIASCKALQTHLQRSQDDAEQTLREWEESIRERDLAEKRRVAPGWLDRDEKILEPERKRDDQTPGHLIHGTDGETSLDVGAGQRASGASRNDTSTREGEELDRAFGNIGL